jgi:hypothetical protein
MDYRILNIASMCTRYDDEGDKIHRSHEIECEGFEQHPSKLICKYFFDGGMCTRIDKDGKNE